MRLDVAAAVMHDGAGRILLAERPAGKHLAGMWEFPGGKLEAGETVEAALARELAEELGINAQRFAPLLVLPWQYDDTALCLHALRVLDWRGEARPLEGQRLRWGLPQRVDPRELAPADRVILEAVCRLPEVS
ncbi:MAG TPA: (deoxy)nucleoside triphosphate pyrophosphohydrolase [Rhodanobacteraceae bacterium]|nr:(deoxy)nucleoside triphosphate pyrophosphohydrolase [Rhodanobacteraceae bacterium]